MKVDLVRGSEGRGKAAVAATDRVLNFSSKTEDRKSQKGELAKDESWRWLSSAK